MDYKDTLHMPKTTFEMKAKLTTKEPGYVERWKEMDLYHKVQEKTKGRPTYTLHDGPPYANGNMHIGHMLNKIIKDTIVRYKQIQGFDAGLIPGWDTHGLPIENAIQKLGVNRKTMSPVEFREKCHDYALEQVEKQKQQLIRMGTFADYDHPYITLEPAYEANQINIFATMAMKGLIYKGKKPVYWSYSSESALAEAEIEYHDIKSPAIYVTFSVKDGKGILEGDEKFVIWTTTPWTLPANLAISLHPDYTYCVVQTNKGKLICLESLSDSLLELFGLEGAIIARYKGQELEGITCYHPFHDIDDFYKRDTIVILGNHVTDEAGTGCVHTAPGHGVDDFLVGQKYGLEPLCPVDERGCLMPETGSFLAGQHVDKANKIITQKLEELGSLLHLSFIKHSYPHDWRTKKPIIFRATDQWFCSVDAIRETILKQIDQVHWVNQWGHVRIYNMIKDRGDWCISRQRVWGLPIPIIYCEDGTPIMEEEVFQHIASLIRQHGSNIWFEKEEKDLLPGGYTNSHSPNGIFKKETDIMDVWFDSGSSHTGCIKERGLSYPVDLYFEGSDQYRGWFNSSLIIGCACYNQAPYKTVLSHGFVLDGKGNKMSKSLGNTIDPIKLTNQYGADILRLWATSCAYQSDVRISDSIMKQVAESYRKIRNTMRFMLGNISDFREANIVPVEQLNDVDRYMLGKLNVVVEACKKAYDTFDFAEGQQCILHYFSNVLSAFYMDFTKDILYIQSVDAIRRRQVQTVLYHHVKAFMRLLSPVLVFTCEEMYDHFTCDSKKEESIFLTDMPEMIQIDNNDEIQAYYDRFLELRKDVLKAIENKRNEKVIGSSLEAEVLLCLKEPYKDMSKLVNDLKQYFIVSHVALVNDTTMEEFDSAYIEIKVFDGHKCPRCWNYFTDTEMENGICYRCNEAVNK